MVQRCLGSSSFSYPWQTTITLNCCAENIYFLECISLILKVYYLINLDIFIFHYFSWIFICSRKRCLTTTAKNNRTNNTFSLSFPLRFKFRLVKPRERWDTFCESAKSRMNLPKIAILSRAVDHWEVHPPDKRAYLYLYLSSLCERTQSRFEIRGHAPSSRELVRRERLTSNGSQDRRFAYALPAEESSPKDARTRDPVSSRGSPARNNPSTSTLAKSICHCAQSHSFSYLLRKGGWNIFNDGFFNFTN